MAKRKPEKPDDLRDFAVHLARMKVRAGELGLYATMQALEPALKKVGWEIADKKKSARILRADVEYTPGKPHTFNGFKIRRMSDEQVVFWGTGPLAQGRSPLREWKDVLRFLKKNDHLKFVIGPTVREFVKENKKIAWAKDGKGIVPRRKSK